MWKTCVYNRLAHIRIWKICKNSSFFLHFTNVLTRKTRSLQNVYLNNGLKFNDGWGITLQSGGKKSKHWIFFDTLSRLRINSLFHYVSNNEKKMYISCPHFHIKRGEHKKVPFKKILLHHCLPKKNTYVCTSFVIPKLKTLISWRFQFFVFKKKRKMKKWRLPKM